MVDTDTPEADAPEGDASDDTAPEVPRGPLSVVTIESPIPPWAWTLVALVLGVATSLWLTRHAWGPHPIAGGDITADLVRGDFGIAHFVAHGRLDGWFPRFMLGHQEFLFNGPGVTWLVALVRGLTFGALSTSGGVKVVALAALALQPFAVSSLGRMLGLDRVGAAIAGILSIAATTGFGVGIEGLFANGLLSHQVGVVWFFFAFAALLKAYDAPSRRRIVVAGLALAGLLLTHLISVMVLAIMFPIALLFRLSASNMRQRLAGIAGVIAAGGAAFALGGFWTVPFFVHRNMHGPVVTWGTDDFASRIADILRGKILFEPFMARVVIVSWLATLVMVALGKRKALVFLAIPAIYLVIAHVSLKYPGPSEITLQLANRGLAYAGIIALFPTAALAAAAIKWVGDWTADRRFSDAFAILALLVAISVTVAHAKERFVGELSPATQSFKNAAVELRRLVPHGARFSLTRDYPTEIERTGVIEPARWLAWASGVDTLNSFNPESSNAGATAGISDGPSTNENIDTWIRSLRHLGVSDIVVDKPAVLQEIQGSSLVKNVWNDGDITIFQVLNDDGSVPPVLLDPGSSSAANMPVTFASSSPERLTWSTEAPADLQPTISVAWSPKWHATIDGHRVPIVRTGENLMQVSLPAGTHTLALAYRPDAADRVGVLLTLLAIIGFAGWPFARRRWFSQQAAETAPRSGSEAAAGIEPA